MEFILSLKTLLIEELSYQHDDIVLYMIQKYPQLLEYSSEFLLNIKDTENILYHFLSTYENQKKYGGLFAHCLKCQHKTKILNLTDWICSNNSCKQMNYILK